MDQHDSLSEAPALPPSLELVEELNHRVANEYSEAILCLSAAARRSDSIVVRETLSLAADRLMAHADAHRALLPPRAGGLVSLADYVGRLCATLSRATMTDSQVRIGLKVEDARLEASRCWRIGLILAELVRNAARHGLRGQPGAISIRVRVQRGRVSCLVCDSGRPSGKPAPGRGQRLVQGLAAELGGTVDWLFTPVGTMVGFEAPLAQV